MYLDRYVNIRIPLLPAYSRSQTITRDKNLQIRSIGLDLVFAFNTDVTAAIASTSSDSTDLATTSSIRTFKHFADSNRHVAGTYRHIISVYPFQLLRLVEFHSMLLVLTPQLQLSALSRKPILPSSPPHIRASCRRICIRGRG